MNKYPYIGKNSSLCGDFSIAIFYGEKSGALLENTIDEIPLHEHILDFNEREFENITAEYLTNTYGKVESKEHAEFIVKLAEANGFTQNKTGANLKSAKSFIFYIDRMIGLYEKPHFDLVHSSVRKLITIPLPPKETLMESQMPNFNVETPMPEVKEPKNVSMNDIQINVKNNTDSVVQVTKSDDESNIFIHVNNLPKSEEWPAVGDEVLICKNVNLLELHRFNGKQCKVIGVCEHDNKKVLTLSHKSCGLAAMNMGEWIKKPPTPEQELDAKLYDFFQCNSEKDLAEAIINGEIEGLTYEQE
ncbi:hypothetical protein TW1_050 [Pseudoalteromonas phage TW1]|uniref:hypothetical protein n=1 Tax=Pseudoalteromonas phage TW1 TaxID=1366055 RepID=UPI00035AB5EE|nr:hypothetical protein PP585_gp50 [Pseudoalteromonas phage TW1]AGR46566.1 hypothetical protein TW1_050 [Pseudoalteromonas phage TW1]